jgi:hypothetical protein
MAQLADAPINLVSLADPLLAEIFEYVGTPGVGKLAMTCIDFRRVAGEAIKTNRAAVLERIHNLTHRNSATTVTYQPSDLKRLRRVTPDLLEPALAELRTWGDECWEAEKVLTLATLARKVDTGLVDAVEKMGKPELLVKLHENKIYLDRHDNPFGLQEVGRDPRALPEGHTLLVPLLPDGVTGFLESVGFSRDDAIGITTAVQGRKESNDSFMSFLSAPRPEFDPEALAAARAALAQHQKKKQAKAQIVARATADSRLCIECGNPPRTHKMIGCDHIMLCGGCRASLEDSFQKQLKSITEKPNHFAAGPEAENNAIVMSMHQSRNCKCLICPKRELRMNPELFDD